MDTTLVRGADGVLYSVAGTCCDSLPEAVMSPRMAMTRPRQIGLADDSAARMYIAPEDGLDDGGASRMYIKAEGLADDSAARMYIAPEDGLDDGGASRMYITPQGAH